MDAPRLRHQFIAVRAQTEALAAVLSAEDCMLQSMPDASPVKWHLAHTTWFFETFVLASRAPHGGPAYRPFHADYGQLFNSYYVGVGAFHPRAERGLLSRPDLAEVLAYRRCVDAQTLELLAASELAPALAALIELGLHHEQQHQELILSDIKHHFSRHPALPAYRRQAPQQQAPILPTPLRFVQQASGYAETGHSGETFCFDNERPRHGVWLAPHSIANRPISNGEYLAFIADNGYQRADLWLSDGWDCCRREGWCSPLYWRRQGSDWSQFTLDGEQALAGDEPVCHVSYYEADAYARWCGRRLCSEAEWECAAALAWNELCEAGAVAGVMTGNFLESGRLRPAAAAARAGQRLQQLFGDVWEWTGSAYRPYPGFRSAAGAIGEYNGKFMINQMVLRGGACVTPCSHIRPSYRNFFAPAARWQFSGIRLAQDSEQISDQNA